MSDVVKCCGNCRYHVFDDDDDDWYCNCPTADAFLSWTGYEDTCVDFEARKPKKLSDRLSSELDRRDRAFQSYKRGL